MTFTDQPKQRNSKLQPLALRLWRIVFSSIRSNPPHQTPSDHERSPPSCPNNRRIIAIRLFSAPHPSRPVRSCFLVTSGCKRLMKPWDQTRRRPQIGHDCAIKPGRRSITQAGFWGPWRPNAVRESLHGSRIIVVAAAESSRLWMADC